MTVQKVQVIVEGVVSSGAGEPANRPIDFTEAVGTISVRMVLASGPLSGRTYIGL